MNKNDKGAEILIVFQINGGEKINKIHVEDH